MTDDERSAIDRYFEEDHPGEISKIDSEPGKGLVKDKDKLLEEPATTSNLPMDDTVTNPDDEGDVLGESVQRIIDDDASKKDL
jgi:hypothetical protein